MNLVAVKKSRVTANDNMGVKHIPRTENDIPADEAVGADPAIVTDFGTRLDDCRRMYVTRHFRTYEEEDRGSTLAARDEAFLRCRRCLYAIYPAAAGSAIHALRTLIGQSARAVALGRP